MSHAKELIDAIQTCRPSAVREVLAHLAQLRADEAERVRPQAGFARNRVNDHLGGAMELTALHVAAKAYAAHAEVDDHLARVFDEMVADLLAAGADPGMEIAPKRGKRLVAGEVMVVVLEHGQTVAQVCEGRLPPALVEWFAAMEDDQNSGVRTEEQREVLSQAAQEAWVRRREREAHLA